MAAIDRALELEQWVAGLRGDIAGQWTTASADASFRRYFRVPVEGGSLIAMDAPPAQEDPRPFVEVAARLRDSAIHVPRILAADLDRGFVLMTDLGATTYMDRLSAATAEQLYGDAIDALVRMQVRTTPAGLPPYDEALLRAELDLFPTWFVGRHLGIEPSGSWWRAWETVCRRLVDSAVEQPRVFVHRDYMPRNLMIATPNPGVLDFQDAVAGPISYDPICLLRDAFVSWPADSEDRWLARYHRDARAAGLPVPDEREAFRRAADLMGAQRHLKVLGVFARLCHRDGKPHYIGDAPRFLGYLEREAAPYRELAPLREILAALPVERARP